MTTESQSKNFSILGQMTFVSLPCCSPASRSLRSHDTASQAWLEDNTQFVSRKQRVFSLEVATFSISNHNWPWK